MARPSDRKENTRDRILDAAEDLFAQKGYSGASIKSIAERAGVTGAMIHYFFHSKEALYQAVLERVALELYELGMQVISTRKPAMDRLQIYIDSFFDYAAKHPNFACLTRMAVGADRELWRQVVADKFKPLFELGEHFIEQGVKDGLFKPINSQHLISAFYSVFVSSFADAETLSAMSGIDFVNPKEEKTRKAFLSELAFRALGADPKSITSATSKAKIKKKAN
jgi:TetR/AcrR family transcriptional regulator